ncbi:MAG TPA: GntR family transcriptional regulator [Ktedonobacteraceae bacterium]|nr:GntR family transcriptional regulator [Ktedonobacteraceae bacterium]
MKAPIFEKIDRISLREHVYRLIQHAIVAGELQPGQQIRDSDLAAQFGVSRTPVREALQRLEDEGLVEMLSGVCTRVVPLDMQAAQEAFPVVAVLHALATRLAVGQLTEEDITGLRRANDDLIIALETNNVTDALHADDMFHRIFVRVANNHEIQHTLEYLMPKVRRLEYAQFSSLAGHTSVLQHQTIIAACEQRSAELAATLTEQNWLSLGQLIVRSFASNEKDS